MTSKTIYQLKLKSFDQELLLYNLITILFELKKKINFIKIQQIRVIPSYSKKLCILRSPFVDKVSKEHFEIKTFQILINIEIYNTNFFFFEMLLENILYTIFKLQEVTVHLKKINIKG